MKLSSRVIAIKLIKIYRLILSPFFGKSCRFYPTCSCYMEDAINRHGMVKGVWLGLKRLVKCHPFHPGGFDPVPIETGAADKSSKEI